jgi:hypothetical protein
MYKKKNKKKIKIGNRSGSVMVSVLASSAIYCCYKHRSGQIKEYKIGICCFFAKNASLRRKSKDWLARNQNNVSEWGDTSTLWLLLPHQLNLSKALWAFTLTWSPSSFVCHLLTFHIFIVSFETPQPNEVKLSRTPSIVASYQVSVHLAKKV